MAAGASFEKEKTRGMIVGWLKMKHARGAGQRDESCKW